MTFYDVLHKTPGKLVDSEDDNSRGNDMIRKSKQNSIFDALVAYASEKKIQEVNMNYIFAYVYIYIFTLGIENDLWTA